MISLFCGVFVVVAFVLSLTPYGVCGEEAGMTRCGPGSIPRIGVNWWLSLLVLYSAPRGFSPATLVMSSSQIPTCNLI